MDLHRDGVGIALGEFAPGFAAQLKPLSTVFLRMIKSVVTPIIFGTLVIGIAGHGDDLKRIGGWRSSRWATSGS